MGRPKGTKSNAVEEVKKTKLEDKQINKTKAETKEINKPNSQTKKRGRPKKSDTENHDSNIPSVKSDEPKNAQLIDQNIDPALLDDALPSKRAKTTVAKPSKPVKPIKSGPAPTKTATIKPLFLTKALRSNFNPLPKTNIDYSSPEGVSINSRCGNPLNSMTIEKHKWLKNVQPDTHHLLIFGAGDMGQMGLGPEKLDDVRKPAIHAAIEELRSENQFATPLHVVGGGMHTLVVDSDGKIWSWGINDNAALGRQTEGIPDVEQEELETRPMLVSKLSPHPDPASNQTPFKAARVSAGDSVSVAVSEEGELVAWGSFRSNDGLLGFDGQVGTSAKQLVPSRVSNLRDYPVSQVVCGYDHVLALTTDGHVYSWGNGQQQQLGRKIIERRKKNGLTPERLSLKKIVLLGTGGSHSFAVNEEGVVYGWGLNTRGQLGISAEETGWEDEIVSVPTPVRAMGPDKHNGARVVAIEGGDFHTLFLLSNGQVWGVGNYENGEIGIKSSAPEIVATEKERAEGMARKQEYVEKEIQRRKAQAEKNYKTSRQAAGKSDKTEDSKGALPPDWDEMAIRSELEQEAANQGFIPGKCLRSPVRLEFPNPIIDISCGTRHNLAVDNEGNAYSWGLGQSNELGQGKDEDGEEIELLETPKLLTSKALSQDTGSGKLKVVKCAAGGTHSLLICAKVPTPHTNGTS